MEVAPFFGTPWLIAHGLEVFADLLFAIAEFFGDLRRGNGYFPHFKQRTEKLQVNRIALQLIFGEAFHFYRFQ